MDQKNDYKEKYEKGKIHVIYLLIIAVILAIIGLSFALGGDDEALGQISMASTVSSIILSSIAIFMSISGENKLTYTHDKLVESSDKLSAITVNIESANSEISQKILKIDDIFDRLERIGQSVDNVEKEVLNRTFYVNEESNVNISSDAIWSLYNDIINRLDEDNTAAVAIKEAMMYVVTCRLENHQFITTDIDKYLNSVINDWDSFSSGITIGIIGVFFRMGIVKYETAKYFDEKIKISKEKRKEIKNFLKNT